MNWNWRWFIFDYADPTLPLSLYRRLRIAFQNVPIWQLPRHMRQRRWLFALGIMLLILPVHLTWRLLFAAGAGTSLSLLLFFTVLAGQICIWWVAGCLLYGILCRREHCYRLRLEGFEVCLHCGYWLRGLGDDVQRCPECGAAREPMPTSPGKQDG